jgi:hypothetical protein
MSLHFLAGGFTDNVVITGIQQAAGPARSTWWSLLRAEAAVKEILVLLCEEGLTGCWRLQNSSPGLGTYQPL